MATYFIFKFRKEVADNAIATEATHLGKYGWYGNQNVNKTDFCFRKQYGEENGNIDGAQEDSNIGV